MLTNLLICSSLLWWEDHSLIMCMCAVPECVINSANCEPKEIHVTSVQGNDKHLLNNFLMRARCGFEAETATNETVQERFHVFKQKHACVQYVNQLEHNIHLLHFSLCHLRFLVFFFFFFFFF